MDAGLRNALWDAISITIFDDVRGYEFDAHDLGNETYSLFTILWNTHFKLPIDTIPWHWSDAHEQFRNHFMKCPWHEVYTLVELIAARSGIKGNRLRQFAQTFMEREMAAYRFVEGRIVEITDEGEIAEIEAAIEGSPKPVATHLKSSLAKLSDRKNPDYRNSVKEAISAVEAAAREITGDKNATLGQALKVLPKKMHPAFEAALSKLYGYTSDASGIRHALSEESSVDAAEARFMLIACSAFINLLRERASKELA
jgi:hypothetical protein